MPKGVFGAAVLVLFVLGACKGKDEQATGPDGMRRSAAGETDPAHELEAIMSAAPGTAPSLRRVYWPCRTETTSPEGRTWTRLSYEGSPEYCVHPADVWHPGCPNDTITQQVRTVGSTRRSRYKYDRQNRLKVIQTGRATPMGPYTYDGMTTSDTERYTKVGRQIEVVTMRGEVLRQRVLIDEIGRPAKAFIMDQEGAGVAATRQWRYQGNKLVSSELSVGPSRQIVTRYIYDCSREPHRASAKRPPRR